MDQDDPHYTYNELSNEDRELLLRNGYKPGELPPEEERELVADLRDELDDDEDGGRLSGEVTDDERDGTE
jgi:hypothetical protein